MLGKMHFLAAALCLSAYASAAPPSIGTVTAHGFTMIDNYSVKGSGTVFDGSVVETGQSALSAADLRLANDNAVVALQPNSRGTIYRDHFLLQQGTVQLGSTDSFRVLANGLTVVPSEAHSSGYVSIDPANSVIVEAQSGTLEIRSVAGIAVAEVHPGHPLALSTVNGKPASEFSAEGTVSAENGRYYLNTSDTGMKYELKGGNAKNFDGASVVASGVLEAGGPAGGVAGLLLANSIQASSRYTLPEVSNQASEIIGGLAIGQPSPFYTVTGADGGTCDSKQLVPCCQNTQGASFWNGKKCCPHFLPTAKQCKGSM